VSIYIAVTVRYGNWVAMAGRVSGRFIGSLFAFLMLCLGYLLYGQQITQSSNPLEAAIASVLNPTLVMASFSLVLVFLLAVVALALRSGRSVRLGPRGLSIGNARR
jgi:hypothetical protein